MNHGGIQGFQDTEKRRLWAAWASGHGEFTKLSIETFPISILTQIIINKVDRTGDIYFTDPMDAKWRIYPEGEKVILEPVV